MSNPHSALRLLDELTVEGIGPVVPKTMVFDRLLDLRNLLADQPLLVAAIDDRLRSVPGATLSPAGWWLEELGALRELVNDALCPEGVS